MYTEEEALHSTQVQDFNTSAITKTQCILCGMSKEQQSFPTLCFCVDGKAGDAGLGERNVLQWMW